MPANIRIYLSGERADDLLKRSTTRAGIKVRAAARGAAQDAAELLRGRITADINSAGNLGKRYASGVQVKVGEGGGNIKIAVTNDVPGFDFLNKGGQIEGKPLMWIPISGAGVPPHTPARDYPGRLFQVKRTGGGVPLLMDPADRKPKYWGAASVTVPQKFHSIDIVNDVASNLATLYKSRYAALSE